MATLHLEISDDCNYVVKKSYKIKTIIDVYNYIGSCFKNGHYIKDKETANCTQYTSNGKKIIAFITKYGQDYSVTEFKNIANSCFDPEEYTWDIS